MMKLRTCGLFTFAPARLCIIVLFCFAAAIAAPAQSGFFTTLANFDGTDGSEPLGGVVQANDGNFYGTTFADGADYGGTVFKVTPAGTLTALYSFCSQPNCADGDEPYAGLMQASDGNFYGTTYGGGANGGGTVFKITPAGVLSTLYSFCSQPNCPDGDEPYAGVVEGSDGNFYGTTWGGVYSYGTVFKITPAGALTTLYNFCSQPNCSDGYAPAAGLVQGTDGNLYGTTLYTGIYPYLGTVFKITPTGTLTTLHTFGGSDGYWPFAPLVQAADGNLYGGGSTGGINGSGTLFKITPAGALTVLYNFCSQPNCADGGGPDGGVVQAADGNFYGTTCCGGAYTSGTVFRVTPTGAVSILHSFDSGGQSSKSGLVQATDGNFYGTTQLGGSDGTVFRVGVVRTCATCRP
jgi:uncharacterized repeat protein (TIGR03803 family)